MEELVQAGAAVVVHETERESVHGQTNDCVTTASLARDKESADKNTHEFSPRALTAVVGASLAFFCTAGFMNAVGLFQDYYFEGPLHSRSAFDISWIGSFGTFAMFLFAAPAGMLTDKGGPMLPMLVGSIGELVAIFMISLCREYYQLFLGQGILLGSSMSFLVLPSLSTMSRHFIKHRGIAVGLCISGSSIGGVIWPIMINKLLNSDGVSFAWTMRIVGFAMMPLMAIACLTVRPPAVKHSEDKEDAAGKHGEKKDTEAGLAILKNAKFLTYCLGGFIFFFGLFSPLFYLTSYATSLHKSPSFAFYLISILNGASFFGRVLPGILGDRYGHFNLLSMGAASCSIIAFCWAAVDSTGGLVVFAIAYGFASGSIMSTQAACAAHLATKETLGTAQGLVLAAGSFAGLFGAPIAGKLIPKGYLDLSMFAGSVMGAGTILFVLVRFQLNPGLFSKI